MFKIDAQNLPFVRTRQALLVLDLQNDFVSTGGILPVESPADFVERILKLVPEFRNSDSIIWIRSVFDTSRVINAEEGECESVITDKELPLKSRGGDRHIRQRARPSKRLIEAAEKVAEANGRSLDSGSTLLGENEKEEWSVDETFLTIQEGRQPQAVLRNTPGANFPEAVGKCVDAKRDLVFEKSAYSAFKDGKLVQTLRARFVTGIYLCGALTNISVFATAMDAARHGYAITIVEDCLGYRSKPRHDEALRKLIEFTGCDIISSHDLVEELLRKAQKQQAPPRTNQRPSGPRSVGIEDLMANLNLRPERKQATPRRILPTGQPVQVAASQPLVASDSSKIEAEADDESFEIKPPPKRERVKTKIKTRRRHSKSRAKDDAGPSGTTDSLSPTSVRLTAASQALEKISSNEGESSVAASQRDSSTIQETLPTNSTEKMELLPDQLAEIEKKALIEAGYAPICAGDTAIIANLLDEEFAKNVFERIRDEVRWQKMSHQGGDVPRLVAVQGEVAEDGSIPIYRHPADESPPLLPFSSTVSLIRAAVEKKLGHSVNHVLIQFYRDGTDYISEHSDKTLDIVPGTFIANVSLGAQRTMVFRTKKQPKTEDAVASGSDPAPRQATREPLAHNSMCKMGLVTNMRWLHAIRQDKRMTSEKSKEELAFDGGRISLTFRSIGTFLDKDQQKIWGQGAIAKTKEEARTVINGDSTESERMIRAFGKENHASEFNWNEHYGEGFDVLHMNNHPKLFLSGDFVSDTRVKLLLAEYNIPWTEGKLSPSFHWNSSSTTSDAASVPQRLPVKFVDNDHNRSTVTGDFAIMLYLSAVYGSKDAPKSQLGLARQFTRLQQSEEILGKQRARSSSIQNFRSELELFEAYAMEALYIAGSDVSLADFSLWPILYEFRSQWIDSDGFPRLLEYFRRMWGRDNVLSVMPAEVVVQVDTVGKKEDEELRGADVTARSKSEDKKGKEKGDGHEDDASTKAEPEQKPELEPILEAKKEVVIEPKPRVGKEGEKTTLKMEEE